jgi:hypothetical protein
MRTQMATMVYANRVPIDIMSISCCRSKMVAIIPAKTTQLYLFYFFICIHGRLGTISSNKTTQIYNFYYQKYGDRIHFKYYY